MVKIHSLNCATLCPPCRRAVNGDGGYLESGAMICHCLLIETAQDGLILVDTGFGIEDCQAPQRRLGLSIRATSRPVLQERETAVRQVEALGFKASDVRQILLTHLDLDHAGGLSDFPAATVHLLAEEKRAAEGRNTWLARSRYRPEQWRHVNRWELYSEAEGECWKGLRNARRVRGIREDILMIPLIGHTFGHAGYGIDQGVGSFLHCGDAYFNGASVRGRATGQRVPWGMARFQQLVATDRVRMNETQAELMALYERESIAPNPLEIFCAHDPQEQVSFLKSLGNRVLRS